MCGPTESISIFGGQLTATATNEEFRPRGRKPGLETSSSVCVLVGYQLLGVLVFVGRPGCRVTRRGITTAHPVARTAARARRTTTPTRTVPVRHSPQCSARLADGAS